MDFLLCAAVNADTALLCCSANRMEPFVVVVISAEDAEEIAGVKCRKSVKYLRVKVTVDRSEQRKIAKEQIQRNLNALRWKLK